jgi:chemotaxis protein CheD
MEHIIKVGMADLIAVRPPAVLTTLGLGSCVGIALFDSRTNIIGLAHAMLPDSKLIKNNANKAKFVDTSIVELITKMVELGANRASLTAKVAGGAQMFSFDQSSDLMRIGLRNAQAVREKLSELRIPIIAEDTGGSFGRTIELYSLTGELLIKTIGHGMKKI